MDNNNNIINYNRLLKIIEKFNSSKILVVGDIMVDHFVYGTVNRISPEAPVPVVNVNSEKLMPGGAANVMNNVAKLGAKVSIIGVIGNDYNGEIFKQMAKDHYVDDSGVLTLNGFTTIIKTRVIAHNQQIVRFDRENGGHFGKKVYKNLLENIISASSDNDIDAVIISDYGKGVIEKRFFLEVVNFLNKKNKFIALDPKVENFNFYKNVSILTPNIKEAAGGSGINIKDDKSLIKAAKKIFKKIKPDNLLITQGEAGMSLFNSDESRRHLKARAKNVYDVTGAGDTVISTLTLAVSAGANIFEACFIANIAAGIAISQLGTYAVSTNEILNEIANIRQDEAIIVN
jgi:D-beta-D-heptose 7-phosphate kinase/D-beta-D-heptose 1-phosphate adenosyltransferase